MRSSARMYLHGSFQRPPPRRKNEILHPAKFPETLIEQLIKIHSSEMDNVFDPMVGTGSTVIAALRSLLINVGNSLRACLLKRADWHFCKPP